MVFSSLVFLYVFLPVAILIYFAVTSIRYKNTVLLIFSLLFYAWGEPIWVILLLFSGFVDYFISRFIDINSNRRGLALLGLITSISTNLLLLSTFKYADFIVDNVNFIFNTSFTQPGILLPVGISFYTFQTLSYTIDVFRGDIKAQRSLIDFMVYVSMFPQLVAGPIVRYSEVHTYLNNRSTDWNVITEGINRFCFGLFKKVVLANSLGQLANKYLDYQLLELSSVEAGFGIILFSAQLYFDFAGYSDMAIGLGKIFGFHFPENFRHPYAAISVGDFYKRWHMTLGRFFRDYVYIPLGGNKRNQIFNILVVWFLTGLWHGASWNFVIWGLFLGFFVVIELIFKKHFSLVPRFLLHIYALCIIIFSRSFFYFVDFEKLKIFLNNLFSFDKAINHGFTADLTSNVFLFSIVILLCIPWDEIVSQSSKCYQYFSQLYNRLYLVINLFFILSSTSMIIDNSYNPFIYFRF